MVQTRAATAAAAKLSSEHLQTTQHKTRKPQRERNAVQMVDEDCADNVGVDADAEDAYTEGVVADAEDAYSEGVDADAEDAFTEDVDAATTPRNVKRTSKKRKGADSNVAKTGAAEVYDQQGGMTVWKRGNKYTRTFDLKNMDLAMFGQPSIAINSFEDMEAAGTQLKYFWKPEKIGRLPVTNDEKKYQVWKLYIAITDMSKVVIGDVKSNDFRKNAGELITGSEEAGYTNDRIYYRCWEILKATLDFYEKGCSLMPGEDPTWSSKDWDPVNGRWGLRLQRKPGKLTTVWVYDDATGQYNKTRDFEFESLHDLTFDDRWIQMCHAALVNKIIALNMLDTGMHLQKAIIAAPEKILEYKNMIRRTNGSKAVLTANLKKAAGNAAPGRRTRATGALATPASLGSNELGQDHGQVQHDVVSALEDVRVGGHGVSPYTGQEPTATAPWELQMASVHDQPSYDVSALGVHGSDSYSVAFGNAVPYVAGPYPEPNLAAPQPLNVFESHNGIPPLVPPPNFAMRFLSQRQPDSSSWNHEQ